MIATHFKLMLFITCHCKIHCDANCTVVNIQTQPQTLVIRLVGCPILKQYNCFTFYSWVCSMYMRLPKPSCRPFGLNIQLRDVNMFACVKAAVNMLPLSVYTSRAINQNIKTGFQGSKVHVFVFFSQV